ncbi:MbtH family NRPS accessory protein [Dactylosporangium sp. NBC_01737]|uniref:MbtH family protein n=1 Tax=Dactylosporangium sp. NBC_01737 TaxID=2975959 RepID=UPI002E15525D|nr:MbtH family NRPS accessory protein [Dactylosporangium sp. NBC_01737]
MTVHDDIADNFEDTFLVVRNDEGQFSVWWQDLPLPAGWTAVGPPADRQACLDQIAAVWTDLRPISVRARAAAPGGAT